VLGREPVLDRNDRQVQPPRHLCGQAGMGVDAAQNETAAVEEDDHGPGIAAGAWIVEPQLDLAGRPGHRHVAHFAKLARRQVERRQEVRGSRKARVSGRT
jgi:hypothetical protein